MGVWRGPSRDHRGTWEPSHLLPFRARISFEARESWGALWKEADGSVGLLSQSHPTTAGAPWEVTHHGAGGAVGAWGSWETLFTLKHRQPSVNPAEPCHACPCLSPPHPCPEVHSPRGPGSLAGHPARASQGRPGGQWGQSSQEGLPSQLPPAGQTGGWGELRSR